MRKLRDDRGRFQRSVRPEDIIALGRINDRSS